MLLRCYLFHQSFLLDGVGGTLCLSREETLSSVTLPEAFLYHMY